MQSCPSAQCAGLKTAHATAGTCPASPVSCAPCSAEMHRHDRIARLHIVVHWAVTPRGINCKNGVCVQSCPCNVLAEKLRTQQREHIPHHRHRTRRAECIHGKSARLEWHMAVQWAVTPRDALKGGLVQSCPAICWLENCTLNSGNTSRIAATGRGVLEFIQWQFARVCTWLCTRL